MSEMSVGKESAQQNSLLFDFHCSKCFRVSWSDLQNFITKFVVGGFFAYFLLISSLPNAFGFKHPRIPRIN